MSPFLTFDCLFRYAVRMKKLIFFVLVIGLVVIVSWNPLGALEEPKFEVVKTFEGFELRKYEPHIVAQTIVKGDFDGSGNRAFRILAGYIFGKNKQEVKMAMTAPVNQVELSSSADPDFESASETKGKNPQTADSMKMGADVASVEGKSVKMAMTAPVNQQELGEEKYLYEFIMPSKFTMETLPTPLDSRVRLKEKPGKLIAAHKYSGTWSQKRYERKKEAFLKQIRENGFEPVGEPVFARYNSPFSLWFLRRNEILIEVSEGNAND